MKSWRQRLVVIGMALGLQGVLLGLAVLIGVMDPVVAREATLKPGQGGERERRLRERAVEQQLARMDRMEAAAAQEALTEPLLEAMQAELAVSSVDVATAVPAMGAMLPLTGLFAEGRPDLTAGMEVDQLPEPEPVAFLGETLTARRIVLLLDVSGSVKTKMERAGMPMERLREEVLRFVEQLGPDHLFGIIQFTRKWQPFREALVPATEAIRAEAEQWMQTAFRTTGTSGRSWNGGYPNGIEAVLAAAFAMDPQLDEVLIVSDGDFQRTPPGGGGQDVSVAELRRLSRRLQRESIGETRISLLGFHPPEGLRSGLREWTRENGDGTLRIRDAP